MYGNLCIRAWIICATFIYLCSFWASVTLWILRDVRTTSFFIMSELPSRMFKCEVNVVIIVNRIGMDFIDIVFRLTTCTLTQVLIIASNKFTYTIIYLLPPLHAIIPFPRWHVCNSSTSWMITIGMFLKSIGFWFITPNRIRTGV